MEIPRSRKKIIASNAIVYFLLFICLAKGYSKAYMFHTNSLSLKSCYRRFTTLILSAAGKRVRPYFPFRSGRLPSSDGRNVNLWSILDKNKNSSTLKERNKNAQKCCICIWRNNSMILLLLIIIIMCLVKRSLQDSINKHFNKHRFWTNFLCANTLRELKLRTTYSGNHKRQEK